MATLVQAVRMALHYGGRDDEALRVFEQLQRIDREWSAALVGLCRVHTAVGNFARAHEACLAVQQRDTEQPAFVDAQLVTILAGQGRRTEAAAMASRLAQQATEAVAPQRSDLAFFAAVAHVGLGEHDAALTWLEQAQEGRSSRLLYLRIDPRFTALRGDPRFVDLVTRVDQEG